MLSVKCHTDELLHMIYTDEHSYSDYFGCCVHDYDEKVGQNQYAIFVLDFYGSKTLQHR